MTTLVNRIHTILSTDPIWSAYALADLQPAFEPYCRWLTADSEDGPGVVLVFSGLDPAILLTAGSAAAVETILQETPDLPRTVYLSIRQEHFAAVDRVYDNSADHRRMLRMALPSNVHLAVTDALVNRLTPADAHRLLALYAHGGPFTPDGFDPYQLAEGVFFGREDDDGSLVAAGGTHIVHRGEGIAAIGNIYTRPDSRGRGHAKAITAAIVSALQADGVHTIVLNVDQRNEKAQALYQKLGFTIHCPFIEGVAEKRGA
ncbi:MAG: GNAT family N-acetyltransferase [Caldilineaceae bacterium]|nr:GNAT family N-acetyltransferase [Caldilineaceae bacterium]